MVMLSGVIKKIEKSLLFNERTNSHRTNFKLTPRGANSVPLLVDTL